MIGGDRGRVVAAELKRGSSFSRPKPGLRKSDPARAKSRSVGGEHQVLRCQRAVLDRQGAPAWDAEITIRLGA